MINIFKKIRNQNLRKQYARLRDDLSFINAKLNTIEWAIGRFANEGKIPAYYNAIAVQEITEREKEEILKQMHNIDLILTNRV